MSWSPSSSCLIVSTASAHVEEYSKSEVHVSQKRTDGIRRRLGSIAIWYVPQHFTQKDDIDLSLDLRCYGQKWDVALNDFGR
jgi:hypothetical protein